MLAGARRRSGHSAGCGGELQQRARMVNRPSSGSSTSTTQPSARKDLSANASPGDRTVVMPNPAASAAAHPLVGRELLERLRQLGVQEDPGQQPVWLHRDTVRVVPVRRIELDRRELVALGRRQHPPGTDRPMVHPLPVRALVETLDGPGVDGPHPVQRSIRVLDPLPIRQVAASAPCKSDVVTRWPTTAHLSSSQRSGDPERREVGRADARPRSAGEDRPVSIGALGRARRARRTRGRGRDGHR